MPILAGSMKSADRLCFGTTCAYLASGGGHPQEGVVRQVRPKAAQHGDSRPGQLPILVHSLRHADISLWTDGQGVSEHTSAHAALPMHSAAALGPRPSQAYLPFTYVGKKMAHSRDPHKVALFVQSNCSDSKFLTA